MSDGTKPSPEPTMTHHQWGLCAFNLRSTSHKMPMFENYCFKIPAAFPWGQWVNDESMIITWENVSYNRNSERKITGRGYDLFPSLNTLLIALPQMTAFRPFFVAMIPVTFDDSSSFESLRWRHNERDSVSNHQPHDCLLNRLFRRRSKKTSRLRVTGLCVGNSPGTGEFPAQTASNVENVTIWWRHHVNGGMISSHKYKFPVKWQFQVSSSQMCLWINRHTNIVTI